jgi:predicted nucleic acid-binding protein
LILDTNVLIYAIGAEHPLKKPAQRIVRALEGGAVEATTSVLVLQEFTYVSARRRGEEEAIRFARAYVDLLEPLLAVEQDHLMTALDLVASVGLRPSDALIAAASLQTTQTLVSADRDFSRVPGLNLVYPDDLGVDELLSA